MQPVLTYLHNTAVRIACMIQITTGLREKRGHPLGRERPAPGLARFIACVRQQDD
jgi:hypothetical protein